MSKVKRAGSVVALAMAVAELVLGLSGSARASGSYICGGGSTGSHCLDDWNGVSGGQVKMYLYGNSNEQFGFLALSNDCGGGHVTYNPSTGTGCPFGDGHLDQQLQGAVIFSIEYNPYGECIDTGTGNGYAYLGTCPDQNGNGGSVGTVMAAGSCPGHLNDPSIWYAIDRYWSDYYAVQVGLTGQGSNGGLVNFTQGFTCWHELS